MTVILNLKEETKMRLEQKAQALGVKLEEMLEKAAEEMAVPETETQRRARLMGMANELFDERASAYQVLAEGAQ